MMKRLELLHPRICCFYSSSNINEG